VPIKRQQFHRKFGLRKKKASFAKVNSLFFITGFVKNFTCAHERIHEHIPQTNATNLDNLKTLMNKAVETYQSLDILVNSAGIFMMKLITEVTEEEYDRLMMINVKGTYFAARFAAEIMRKNNARGSIINLSSIAGINGFGDMSTY
jgi:NAD(P)-dependent dehydrogenase (short-subunit alcohol dehydrogenase family)